MTPSLRYVYNFCFLLRVRVSQRVKNPIFLQVSADFFHAIEIAKQPKFNGEEIEIKKEGKENCCAIPKKE